MTARSAERPNASSRVSATFARGPGPRSPDACSSTAGSPARAASPCSETVSGSARRAHWPIAREPPACVPASRRTADSSVRRIAIGAARSPFDHGTIHGLWTRRLARSPSTIAASTGPSADSANERAPAAPALPPEVETSTSVDDSSRTLNSRAISISAAVPDSSASAGDPSASRWAITTMRWLESPGRTPTTVSSRRLPSTVRSVVVRRVTRKPPCLNVSATRPASARSPGEPGARFGNASPSSPSSVYARPPSKPAGANGVVTAAGRSASEKAATNSAIRAGASAAR